MLRVEIVERAAAIWQKHKDKKADANATEAAALEFISPFVPARV